MQKKFISLIAGATVGVVLFLASPASSGASPEPVRAHTAFVPLRQAAEALRLEPGRRDEPGIWTMSNAGNAVSVAPGMETVIVNDQPFVLSQRVRFQNGEVYVPHQLVGKIRPRLSTVTPVEPKIVTVKAAAPRCLGFRRVVIDAGHGGKDPGALGPRGTREKDIALDIARRLATALRARGVEVILTRADDRFLELEERARIANRADADLFVCIHIDGYPSPRPRGFEVHYLDTKYPVPGRAAEAARAYRLNPARIGAARAVDYPLRRIFYSLLLEEFRLESRELAQQVAGSLRREIGREIPFRRVAEHHWRVIRRVNCPHIFCELGFLTNRRDEALLRQPSFRARVAGAIADGIVAYSDALERNNGFAGP